MKFWNFILKSILADTDYLVGYNADGDYICISRDDLAASIASVVGSAIMPTLAVKYSANGESWHDSYTAGDHYTRIKAGSGAWSAAIPLCVSAYDIWKQQGNRGTEEEFIASLQGPAGAPADISSVTIQDIRGYADFLSQVNAEIQNAKTTIINEVTDAVREAMQNELANKLDKDLSNISESGVIADNSYIPVVVGETMWKVKADTMALYTKIKINSGTNSPQNANTVQ